MKDITGKFEEIVERIERSRPVEDFDGAPYADTATYVKALLERNGIEIDAEDSIITIPGDVVRMIYPYIKTYNRVFGSIGYVKLVNAEDAKAIINGCDPLDYDSLANADDAVVEFILKH